MQRLIRFDQARRFIAMCLACIILISIFPQKVNAASGSVLTTDIGDKKFVVGTPTEFTFTTTANDDLFTMVKGSFMFNDPEAIEKLEYKESKDGNWYEFYGDFGPETGFPMTDATSTFRVTFKKVGTYTLYAYMKSVEDGTILCSNSVSIDVDGKSELTTNISSQPFVVNEPMEFTFTTMANEDAGILSLGSFVFSNPEAIDKLEYRESKNGNWYEFSGDFGPSTGFPLIDNATSYFRVTFNKAGAYTLNAYMKRADNGDILCQTTANVNVKQRSEISFATEVIEIKYSDVNATNNSLHNDVSGASFSYISSDNHVVTVDAYGILRPVSVGEATITVTREETAYYMASSATYLVKVIAGDQAPLSWNNTIPSDIQWNHKDGYSNTVSGGSGSGKVTYISDNVEVAAVDADTGVLTMKKPGVVTITAVKDGAGLYNTQSITYTLVIIKAEQEELVFQDSNPSAIYYGDYYANIATGGSSSAQVQYKSSDDTIASVDENGVITTYKQGNVTITAWVEGDEFYEPTTEISYNLTIYRAIQPTGLVFSKGTENQIITCGDIGYINEVIGGDTSPIYYTSSDESVALVDSLTGEITTLKSGVVTITATAPASEQYEEQSISYVLVIERCSQIISFAHTNESIPVLVYGDSYQNTATALTDITYVSSDETVATVNPDGSLNIYKAGTITITAVAKEDDWYKSATAAYTVTINKATQTADFEKSGEVEITFNDNDNKFVNSASTSAILQGENDIFPFYSISVGEHLVKNFDSQTGSFDIVGAGTVVITVLFNENDRYLETSTSYTLIINKANQTIAFPQNEYSMVNGNLSFISPVAEMQGDKYGMGQILYHVVSDTNDTIEYLNVENGELTFTRETGVVTIRATKAADDNYEEASAEYVLYINEWVPTEILYTALGDTVNESGWFVSNVSIGANTGYQLSYERRSGSSDWKDVLNDAIVADGESVVDFYIKNLSTGEISAKQQINVKKDTVVPSAEIYSQPLTGWEKFLSIITLNIWQKSTIDFVINSSDITSSVEKVEYYIDYLNEDASNKSFVLSESELNAVTEWVNYKEPIRIEKNNLVVIYAKVTDIAGNYVYATTNGIVFDRNAPVADIEILTESYCAVNDSENIFYHTDVEMKISAKDAAPYSGIANIHYEVYNGDILTQNGCLYDFDMSQYGETGPAYSDLVSSYTDNIIIDSKKNNSDDIVVRVSVCDNAGNKFETEKCLKICTEEPTLDISFVSDPSVIEYYDGVYYYDANRTAKIEINARTSVWAASNLPQIVIHEAKGDAEESITYTVENWITIEGETPDSAIHTCYIHFNGSANYDFSVNYTDIFGCELTYTSDKFVVDHDAPVAEISIDSENVWRDLVQTLTFGLWKNEVVDVKASAFDQTSPIKSIEYYKSNEQIALTTTQLEEVNWLSFSAFTVDKDEQFVIYLKVTDYAGHVSYISSDGYIVDMTNSNIVLTPDEPNQNSIYNSDVNVTIDVEDFEPYSGIKSVEYWVFCDEQETAHEVLYSFEYTKSETDNGGSLHIYENGQLVKSESDYEMKQEDLKRRFHQSIIIDSTKNNSDDVSLLVKVVDNAGNEAYEQLEHLKIDITAPKIEVSFNTNNANVVDGRGYFNSNREATITITERSSNFNEKNAVENLIIHAFDQEGNAISLSEMIGEWTTVESNIPDEAKHIVNISFMTDANYEFAMSYIDEAGNECRYEDVVFADDTISERYFTIDKKAPSATILVGNNTWETLLDTLTFGLFSNDEIQISATAMDEISPVIVEYYKTNGVLPLDAEKLNAITDWTLFEDFTISNDEIVVVYLRVTDYAGNYIYINSDGYIVDKTESMIEMILDKTDIYHNDIPLYNKDVNVRIDIQEKKDDSYSGLKSVACWVICDGKETQRELHTFEKAMPSYNELKSSFSTMFTVLSEKNNSCDITLYVGVTDNAGNYAEDFVKMDIDITNPMIEVGFDYNDANKIVGEKGYFSQSRKALISITERTGHFDIEKSIELINIVSVDAEGKNVLKDYTALIGAWETEGEADLATHKTTIDFAIDGNYEFSISYTDLAGNTNISVDTKDSVTPYQFTVDTTNPEGTISVVGLGTWDKLIEILTFGLWSKDTVDVKATAMDTTSPIESVMYYKTSETKALTIEQLKDINDWRMYEEFSVSANEQFVVYLQIIDYCGNVTYISTNGVIVDDTQPNIESIKPKITITPAQPVNGIYNSNVNISVKVEDPIVMSGGVQTYSGLKEIRYEVYNKGKKTQDGILYSFDENNPQKTELLQVWEDTSAIIVKSNLNNSNDVSVKVYAFDNAGNSCEDSCSLQIDTTSPQITLDYNNNQGDESFNDGVYFNANRIVTITVMERNFDPVLFSYKIKSNNGYNPKLSSWKTVAGSQNGNGDDTKYIATISFDRDGEYELNLSCEDLAGNDSGTPNYGKNIAPKKFTIDKTAPVVQVTYDNRSAKNGNYYCDQRIATITVNDKNFTPERVVLNLTATNADIEVEPPIVSDWVALGNNDYSITVLYSEDAYYTFDFDCIDKAGNTSSDIEEQSFYVDKTEPKISIIGIVDESANNANQIGFEILVTDTNIDVCLPVLTAVVRTINGYEVKKMDITNSSTIENGYIYKVDNIELDGIYHITCTLVDKAGNEYTKVTLQNSENQDYIAEKTSADKLLVFSVNRNGSVYEVDENTLSIMEHGYIQNLKNDIVITEINTDELQDYMITLNGATLIEGVDYTVVKNTDSDQWEKYIYTVNKNLFESEKEYVLTVSSKDKANNLAFSDVKGAAIHFIVDRTSPTVTITGLANNSRYQTERQSVTLIPMDNGGALQSVKVYAINDEGAQMDTLLDLSGEALEKHLETNNGKLNFEVTEGLYQNFKIVCADISHNGDGKTNIYEEVITNVSVSSSVFMIFWANKTLRWSTIGGVGMAMLIACATIVILKSKKSKKQKKEL